MDLRSHDLVFLVRASSVFLQLVFLLSLASEGGSADTRSRCQDYRNDGGEAHGKFRPGATVKLCGEEAGHRSSRQRGVIEEMLGNIQTAKVSEIDTTS